MRPLKTYKERYLKILKDGSKHGNQPGKTQDDKLDKLFEDMSHEIFIKQRDNETLKRELAYIVGDPILAPMILYRDKIKMLEHKVDCLISELSRLNDKDDDDLH